MQKLMIADGSDIFASALEAALKDDFQVCTCADGETALQLLPQYQPDILILNLMLPYMDGVTLLEQSSFRPKVILAIAMHLSAYVEQSIVTLGIDYTLISPSVKTVVLRLKDLLQQYTVPADGEDPSNSVTHHLHLLNFPTHLDGYKQLCIALPLFAQDPHQYLTKVLYPTVAQIYGCEDGRSVEHSIRKAIQAAWKHRDNATWCKYFALGPQGTIPCPTNKEFLCRMVEILNGKA